MADNIITDTESTRPVQPGVPTSKALRDRLLYYVRQYISRHKPVPPASVPELRKYAADILELAGMGDEYLNFTVVLVNNELWRRTVAATPFEKRLLLLPKCVRDIKNCQGSFDEIGLICEHCGRCLIDEFQSQAEQLGYAVLVAEGSPVVMSLIEAGKIEVVIGVSCLSVLESVFPYMEAGAVPGIAIPLLRDGCKNTFFDEDWLWQAIYEQSSTHSARLNIDKVRECVYDWFTGKALEDVFGKAQSSAEKIAIDWMTRAGKRWRPVLTAGVYCALVGCDEGAVPTLLQRAAVAVECFHKASLIHDDIEDDDNVRYGKETLHAQFGIPIALNVGDYLIGQGYRLLAQMDAEDSIRAELLAVAAESHKMLCVGQGQELTALADGEILSCEQVLDIFSKKTSPAFETALKFGAVLAGKGAELAELLSDYSRSLGLAYQIRDDIDDWCEVMPENKSRIEPSLLLSLAHERADEQGRKFLEDIWRKMASGKSCPREEVRPEGGACSLNKTDSGSMLDDKGNADVRSNVISQDKADVRGKDCSQNNNGFRDKADSRNKVWLSDEVLYRLRGVFQQTQAVHIAVELMERYKAQAMGCLKRINDSALKSLLRRVICRIFSDIEEMGCCDNYQKRHPQTDTSSEADTR